MKSKKDAVILATFRFCNNLGNYELFDQDEWPEIANIQSLAIYSSYEENNKIERPDFYEKYISEYEEGWVTTINSAYTREKSSRRYDPIFRELTPDLMFYQCSGIFYKKGDPVKKRKVFPKSVYKVFEKHKDEIYLDTYLWRSTFNRYVKIRKEFFDDYTN